MNATGTLAARAEREVIELHTFFVEWLRGAAPPGDFSRAETAIGKAFRMISPDGTIEESAAVLAWIKAAHGSRPRPFDIVTLDPRPVWEGSDAVLLEYTEQQYRDGKTTRRRSTALFVASPTAPNGVEWRHLQETWLETAEA